MTNGTAKRPTDTEGGLSRRAFLEGATQSIGALVAVSAAAPAMSLPATDSLPNPTATPAHGAAPLPATPSPDPNYPPALQGLRGQNDASFKYAHALREGALSSPAQQTGETYDLVVVGAGMSGLSAAYFFRKRLPHAKVLILDNCDDFGGHARRNEFVVDDRLVMANGGAVLILNPNTYSPEGKALLADIGINGERFAATTQDDSMVFQRLKLGVGAFFDKEAWGTDRLVPGYPSIYSAFDPQAAQNWRAFIAKAPVSKRAAADLLRVAVDRKDYLSGLTVEQKIAKLRKTSYESYLKDIMHVGDEARRFYQQQTGWYTFSGAAGTDSFSAWAAYRVGLGGLQGLGLPAQARGVSNFLSDEEVGMPIMMPDGNGGVARLLVRWLIPQAVPGNTMEDSVTAHINYSALDQVQSEVRLRLNSTVVSAKHVGEPSTADEVDVTYINAGRGYSVKARTVVMACFNAMVPYICPELPLPQKEAMHMAVRKALVITNVAVRNWRPFAKAGVYDVVFPTGFYPEGYLISNPGLGGYRRAQTPDEPTVVQFAGAWNSPGLPERDQARVGRAKLLGLSIETLEQEARSQLQRAFSPYGFDADRDVAGITVNRWGHGLVGGANDLFDPEWPRDQVPWVRARKRFGLIAIANSDSAAIALTQCAFDQAHRAVTELVLDVLRPQPDYQQGERT